jgi:hypothetical protein
LLVTTLHIRQRRAQVLYFSDFSWISYPHLNVGQTSENPIDCVPQTSVKPHWASPNPSLTPDCDRWINPLAQWLSLDRIFEAGLRSTRI